MTRSGIRSKAPRTAARGIPKVVADSAKHGTVARGEILALRFHRLSAYAGLRTHHARAPRMGGVHDRSNGRRLLDEVFVVADTPQGVFGLRACARFGANRRKRRWPESTS